MYFIVMSRTSDEGASGRCVRHVSAVARSPVDLLFEVRLVTSAAGAGAAATCSVVVSLLLPTQAL